MYRLALLASLIVAPLAGQASSVPSGHALELQEQFWETLQDGTQVFRQRFVMPAIAEQSVGYMQLVDDFEYLCTHSAIPEIAAENLTIDQIVISLSDRETEFGVASPEAIQYFEAFSLKNDICIWEAFQ